MPANLSGVWKVSKTDDNFADFLKECGAPLLMRQAASKINSTQTIEQNGDNFRIKVSNTFKTIDVEFSVGTESEQDNAWGGKMMTIARWDGDKLVTKNTPKDAGKGKENTVTREIVNGQLVMTLECGGVTTHRYWDKTG